jgi:ATP/maltotriose-dependent transcriptional regulator MalT
VEVLRCLIERGVSDKEICRVLDMGLGTLHHHMAKLRATFGVTTRLQLVGRALAFLGDFDAMPKGGREKNAHPPTAGSGL